MPSTKVPCPQCDGLKSKNAALCGKCGKGKYVRTPEARAKMSAAQKGVPRPYARGPRPDVAKKIAAAWTPEMREAARQRGLAAAADPVWRAKVGSAGKANPNYRHGLGSEYGPGFSVGMKKRLIASRGGVCESCSVGGRLDVHHRDFGKTDHSEANLAVLCRPCHKSLHAANSDAT